MGRPIPPTLGAKGCKAGSSHTLQSAPIGLKRYEVRIHVVKSWQVAMVLVPSHSFAFLLRLVKLLLQDLAAVPTQHELSAMKLHNAANSHGIPFRQIDRPLQFVSDMAFRGIPGSPVLAVRGSPASWELQNSKSQAWSHHVPPVALYNSLYLHRKISPSQRSLI